VADDGLGRGPNDQRLFQLFAAADVTIASSGEKPLTCSASFWMKLSGMKSGK